MVFAPVLVLVLVAMARSRCWTWRARRSERAAANSSPVAPARTSWTTESWSRHTASRSVRAATRTMCSAWSRYLIASVTTGKAHGSRGVGAAGDPGARRGGNGDTEVEVETEVETEVAVGDNVVGG